MSKGAEKFKTLGKKTSFLYRVKFYVNIGHGSWIGFLISIGTFMMVLYQYGTTYFRFFRDWFLTQPILFMIIALPTYLIIVGLIGYWALNSGAEPTRNYLDWTNNPAYQELKKQVSDMEEKIDMLLRRKN